MYVKSNVTPVGTVPTIIEPTPWYSVVFAFIATLNSLISARNVLTPPTSTKSFPSFPVINSVVSKVLLYPDAIFITSNH